jgi:hypothetical protein
MTKYRTATNNWGTFQVDEDSNLPVLPEGQYWKVSQVQGTVMYYYLNLMTHETVERKRWLRRSYMEIQPKVLDTITLQSDDFTPEKTLLKASQLLTTATPEWQEKMRVYEEKAALRRAEQDARYEERRAAELVTTQEQERERDRYRDQLLNGPIFTSAPASRKE